MNLEDLKYCDECGGSGRKVFSRAEHHPECDGSCNFCPIEIEDWEYCEVCRGSGGKPTIQFIKDIMEVQNE